MQNLRPELRAYEQEGTNEIHIKEEDVSEDDERNIVPNVENEQEEPRQMHMHIKEEDDSEEDERNILPKAGNEQEESKQMYIKEELDLRIIRTKVEYEQEGENKIFIKEENFPMDEEFEEQTVEKTTDGGNTAEHIQLNEGSAEARSGSSSTEPNDQTSNEIGQFTVDCGEEHNFARQDCSQLPSMTPADGDWVPYSPGLLRISETKVQLDVDSDESDDEASTSSVPLPPISQVGRRWKPVGCKRKRPSSEARSSRNLFNRRRPGLNQSEAVFLALTGNKNLQSSLEQARLEYELTKRRHLVELHRHEVTMQHLRLKIEQQKMIQKHLIDLEIEENRYLEKLDREIKRRIES